MEFFQGLIAGPVLPATIVAGLMVCWGLFAIFGAMDLEIPSGDMDVDLDVDVADVSVGNVTSGFNLLAWLNLGRVPLVLWAGVFAIGFWFVSISSWLFVEKMFFEEWPGFLWSVLLSAKSFVIAIFLTKFATAPMGKWFDVQEVSAKNLVGQECEISSLEATPDFGQVKYKTEGAPLLLNVRTDGPHLAKGTRVWIIHYDAQKRVYVVTPTGTE